jgi:sialate O-acetylesterase
VVGSWAVCSPETAKTFSAVGYFFGRELQRRLNVPIGLINAPWFGTWAEAWVTTETLNADPILAPTLRYYWPNDPPGFAAAWKDYEQTLAKWWQEHPDAHAAFQHDAGNRGLVWGWNKSDYDDGAWKPMDLPRMWNGTIDVDGAVWFRKQVMIPEAWAGKELELSLGPIKDFDVTYFNGKQVGATGGEGKQTYTIPRRYRIAGEQVKAGAAVIAVRVFDERGGGGFGGDEKSFTLSVAGAPPATATAPAEAQPVWLKGPWKYKIERPLDPNDLKPFPADMPYPTFIKPEQPNLLPGGLFNAMIHPLLGYGFAGAAWYQGESNADRGEQYRALLPAMIGDWRRGAGREFPFLVVQLPTYGGGTGWAEVREAEAMTAQRLPKVGMAVIMDIWDGDLHPKIKLPVGQRLALQALAVAYGQKIVAGGPVYKSMTIDGRNVRLKFDGIGGGLAINNSAPGLPKANQSAELRGFSLAGSDGRFYPAKTKIEGDTVVLWTEYVPSPLAARYCFADGACDGNLCNAEGLPCGTFRTDDWPVQTTGKR